MTRPILPALAIATLYAGIAGAFHGAAGLAAAAGSMGLGAALTALTFGRTWERANG